MRLTEFSVENFQFTVVAFAMLIVLGITSWIRIPRHEDPPLDFPIVMVVAAYPGARPIDLERLVVRHVEERVDQLDDVDQITSRMVDGLATIMVEFDADQDSDAKYDEVLQEMNGLRPDLPAELTSFTVEKVSTLNVAIAQVALVSPTLPYHELDRLAEDLSDRLGTIPGVRTADRWGAPARRVEVALDLGRLSRLRLPPGLVLGAIEGESADIPSGSVEAGRRRFSVRASGSYEELDEIRETVLRTSGGQLLRVGDVADVKWGYADSTYRARFDGRRAVFVTVTQQERENVAAVRDRVWAALDVFEQTLPPGVTLERGFDQAQNVSHRLARLGTDFAIAIGLVLLTLLPLGTRAAAIVMVSIPLSLAIGLTLLYWTGFTINQLTIVGAVLSLGLLVDDSIVVAENIARHLRAGHSARDAAIKATGQIAVAVLGATATLIFAFVPLLLLPGAPGQYIRSLPVAVIYVVLSSLFVSLTIVPWLASLVFKGREPTGSNRVLLAFDHAIGRTYAPILDRALRRPIAALVLAGLMVAGSALLMPLVGFSLFPKAETPQFYVNITAPEGASIEVTDEAAAFAERVMAGRPAVRAVFTSVGRDNPQIYYNVPPRREHPGVGQLFVLLHRYDPGAGPALLDSLRSELADYPAARLELREFENGPPIDAPIALRVQGPDVDTLRILASEIEKALASTPGTQYVNNPVRLDRTDLRVVIDRGKAGLLDVPTLEIDRTLRLAIEGVEAGALRERSGDERAVVVRLSDAARPSPAALDRVYVASRSGDLVPLRQLSDVRFERGLSELQRVDRERAVTVTSFVRTNYNTDRVTQTALATLENLQLPADYRITAAGEIESRRESFGGVGNAVIVATFAILAILVLEFRTFRSTLIVASVIPLGMAGGILALFLTGNSLSFTATLGFVALIGIEIKTSILLVDFTNQLRAEGVGLDEAIRQAGEVRFLPIVLTTLTAIGGLLPLALGGQALYAPLAWVIIGGLISSTLLARLITPVVYKLLAPAVEHA